MDGGDQVRDEVDGIGRPQTGHGVPTCGRGVVRVLRALERIVVAGRHVEEIIGVAGRVVSDLVKGVVQEPEKGSVHLVRDRRDPVIYDDAPSLAMKRATAGGFHRVDQEELLRTFVEPFFGSVLPIWESHNSEEVIVIIRMMYPRTVIAQEVVDATDAALATDLPGPLRRTLLESQDGIKRALRAQAFDRAGTGVRPIPGRAGTLRSVAGCAFPSP